VGFGGEGKSTLARRWVESVLLDKPGRFRGLLVEFHRTSEHRAWYQWRSCICYLHDPCGCSADSCSGEHQVGTGYQDLSIGGITSRS
jgi:hypothetical protein